jgi:hypothetical protein
MSWVPIPLDVELLGMKPCSFSEMLHIVKELEYMVAWFPNLKMYCLIYWLQNYLIIRFVPPMLAIITKLGDFEQIWKIQYMEF